jgi:hypothetical protein
MSLLNENIEMFYNKRMMDDVIADLALIFYVYNKNKKVINILTGYRKRRPFRNIYMSDDDNEDKIQNMIF